MGRLGLATRRPPAPEPQARALALGRLLVGGGALGLVALLAAGDRGLPRTTLAVLCVLAVAAGAVVLRAGARLPPAAFHGVLGVGWLTIGVSVALVGGGSAALALGLLTVWAALYAGLFFTPVATGLHTAGAVGVVALGMARGDEPWVYEIVWLAGVSGMVGGVTNWMSYRRVRSRLDPLTGVPGRRGLADVLEDRMRQSREQDTPLTIGLLDLDDFRTVNASGGPQAGDRLLRDCVGRWLEHLPPGATLARRGSDEFVVVLPGTGLGEGRHVVERLRRAAPAEGTCSAGVTALQEHDTQSLLLARADTALYAAKIAGRDRTEVAGQDAEAVAELQRALRNGEFVAHYQPVFDLDRDRLVGVEALVRWRHPERGLLDPGAFLSAAEATGLVRDIGRHVLRLACRQLEEWRRTHPGRHDLRVAVNLSPSQLGHPDLLADVEAALGDHDLDPAALILEVTEGALDEEQMETVAVLWELRDRGVRLALDDFGTGHSSLSRLRSLPFDILKIDRSFVRPLGSSDPTGESLFAVIVRMAESLGMDAVAEGVESSAELEVVRRHGAAFGQGYYLARPAAPDALHDRLAAADPAPAGASQPGAPAPDRVHDEHGTPDGAGEVVPPAAAPGLRSGPGDDAGRRVLRSLLAHIVGATGLETAYLTRVDLEAGVQHVLVAHNAEPEHLRVEEGASVEWRSSICRHALLQGRARATEVRSPLVGDRVVRAYVTAPVLLDDGSLYGTLCAISTRPREVDDAANRLLEFIARLVAEQLQQEHGRPRVGVEP